MAMRVVLRGVPIGFALLMLLLPAKAMAASQLVTLHVIPVRGETRLQMSFAGGVPAGWHVTGSGSTEVTLVFPQTTRAGSVQASYRGGNQITGITMNQAGPDLEVGIHLSTVAQVAATAGGSTVEVDIIPSPIGAPSPSPTLPPTPQYGFPRGVATSELFEVIPLKYADVSEVAGVLAGGQQVAPNDSFTPSGSIFSLPTSTGGISGSNAPVYQGSATFSPSQTTDQSLGQRINDNVAIDRRLNAVILTGTPQQVAELKAVITKLDIPLPSVMLDCDVVELSQTGAHDVGLDLTSGPSTPVASGSIQIGGNVTENPNGTPVRSASLQAQLFATIAHGGGKLLATPRILAVNGTSAQILSGDALPIISTTIYPGTPTITQVSVNYIAVGINLQIQPRIAADGFVTSHIYAEVSSVTAFVLTQQGEIPQISLRQVSTQATVKDGQPFIVGGLLKDEEIDNLSKIPVLGDLPVVGGIFRVRHNTTTRTNLYILITPHIIQQVGIPNPESVPARPLPRPEVIPFPTHPPAE